MHGYSVGRNDVTRITNPAGYWFYVWVGDVRVADVNPRHIVEIAYEDRASMGLHRPSRDRNEIRRLVAALRRTMLLCPGTSVAETLREAARRLRVVREITDRAARMIEERADTP